MDVQHGACALCSRSVYDVENCLAWIDSGNSGIRCAEDCCSAIRPPIALLSTL
jgi:hypothetical protein